MGLFTPLFYMQLYAISHGVDESLAFYTITILNGASVVCLHLFSLPSFTDADMFPQIGRILPNLFGDIWGPFNAVLVCTGICIVLIFAMLAATTASGIIAICVLYGLFSGACACIPFLLHSLQY